MKLIHTVMLLLSAAFTGLFRKQTAFLQANASGAGGTHPGAISYTATTAIAEYRFVQFSNAADGHDRGVEQADGTGDVIGVSLGNSAAGEAVAVHMFGSTPGTVLVETTGAIGRLDNISVAAGGKGVVAGDGAALSAVVLAAALTANDKDAEVECIGNPAHLFA